MPTNIKCPSCGTEFPMEEAVSEEYKKELRVQMVAYKKQKDDEFQKREKEFQAAIADRETEFLNRLQAEKNELQKTLEQSMRKSIGADYENQLQLLQQSFLDSEERLKQSRQRELEFLQKEKALKTREEELEIYLQRQVMEEREKMKVDLIREEASRLELKEREFQLRLKELEKQLDDQKKLTEEMKRRQEQGSMQLQGEVQELLLEEILRNAFPFDTVAEVGKGVRGADCIQTVRNNFGQECGRIIYESKRTENFSADWIEKLKADMRSQGADIAVIVTRAMPKDMTQFGEKNGVYICSFAEVRALAHVIREGLIRVFSASRSQQNKGDKMNILYDYLTSTEFSEQWKAIREGFTAMRQSIQKERDMMERLWKAREKQLEKVLLNSAQIKGSIEGIAGQDSIDLSLSDEQNLLEI